MWKRIIFFPNQTIEGNSHFRGPNTVTESKYDGHDECIYSLSFVRSTLAVPDNLHIYPQLRGHSEDFKKSTHPSQHHRFLHFWHWDCPSHRWRLTLNTVNVLTIFCVLTAFSTLPVAVFLFRYKEKQVPLALCASGTQCAEELIETLISREHHSWCWRLTLTRLSSWRWLHICK